MTRRDHCRQVSPEHLRACGVSEKTIEELKQTKLFTEEHPQICQSSTEAVKTLMKIPDPEIKEKVISHVEKSLESGLDPATGKFTKSKAVTQTQVKAVIAKIAPKTIAPSTPQNTCFHWRDEKCHAASDYVLNHCTPENHKKHNCTLEPMCPPTPAPAHGILSICRVRNKGEPCENLDANDTGLEWCTVEKKCPGFMIACPLDVAKVAGVSPEQIRPHDKTGPFTPASEIPKGLVDLNTPDTRTDPKPFVPVHPITRTDPLDKACGVVKMQPKTTDYETLAKEGDMYPITKRTAQTINQMVEYGISPDNLDAHALIEKYGYDDYLEQIEELLQKEEAADTEAIA